LFEASKSSGAHAFCPRQLTMAYAGVGKIVSFASRSRHCDRKRAFS